ncbi:response regulator transcription factor [Marinimicrobium alkaliphilum]|uniref:response regulator transcription factor n=1 Tax=Marinimicrobium alkaliphilum TaxID=2202654 RepID=UPI000DBA21C4|nr:helix-turn-helix transcriptional regulator [Marinimicrobium alkaliphilum]
METDISENISEFLLAIHDASARLSAEDFQHWTLKQVRRYIDFDFAIWGAGDRDDRDLHTVTVLDQTSNLFATWEPVKQEDPFADLVLGNAGRTWTLNDVPDIESSRAYNEHWRLYRAQQMMSTMQADPATGLHVFVTLVRDRPEGAFTEAEIRFKNLITKHLLLAAHHNDRFNLERAAASAALVDRRGVVHAASGDFKTLAQQTWGRPYCQRLPARVTAALWSNGCFQAPSLELQAEAAGSRLLVRARERVAMPLSERELEVAWAYARGQSHKEVAKDLGVSPTTIRCHLSRAYRKLGVGDKGALAVWLSQQN